MRALKLFRRADDRPTIKDRAAALKARLARLTRRNGDDTDTSRRIMVAGSLAAAAFPLPALAAPVVLAGPHPDAAVFEASARMQAAEAAYYAASRAHSAAHRAARSDIGVCPPGLVVPENCEECVRLEGPWAPIEVRRTRIFQWVRAHEEDENHSGKAWTAAGLRVAITYAVPAFGRAGQTPHRLRRWRSLLPTAEAFDAHRAAAESRHRLADLTKASRETRQAWTAAQEAFDLTPATTTAGLALIASRVGECDWGEMPGNWRNLLVSAANVSGATLRERDGARAPIFM